MEMDWPMNVARHANVSTWGGCLGYTVFCNDILARVTATNKMLNAGVSISQTQWCIFSPVWEVSGHFPRTYPRTYPPDEKLYISWTKCHKSNFSLHTELFPSIPLPFQQITFFIKWKGRLYRFLGLFRHFLTFSLHSKDFFHHCSFELSRNCFINPASTWRILFHHSSFYLRKVINIFSGGKSPGEMSGEEMS